MDFLSVISFLGTAIVLTLMPGPDNLFTLAQSISNGKKRGDFYYTRALYWNNSSYYCRNHRNYSYHLSIGFSIHIS